MSGNPNEQQLQQNRNGSDIESDDNWDDWGDAEEDIDTVKTERTSSKEVNHSNIGKSLNVQEKVNTNSNSEDVQSKSQLSVHNVQEKVNNTSNSEDIQSKSKLMTTNAIGWSSLFGGVVSSVLSTASGGLGNITSTVTHGLDKVIGVPDPEEMARLNVAKQTNAVPVPDETNAVANTESSLFGLNLVSGVTTLGSKVLNSGLDTLEGIGKKTMDILQENDPLLKDKIRKFAIESEKPNLSELLKQAKMENEHLEQSLKQMTLERSRAQLRFEVLFENKCGLVHMEALEILSKEAQLKLDTIKDSLNGEALEDFLETIHEIKELLELEDLETDISTEDYSGEELQQKLQESIEDAELSINFDDIVSLWSYCLNWLSSEEICHNIDAYIIFSKGLTALSETCALGIQKFHKIAELLLIKDHHSTANEVDALIQLTKLFTNHLQMLTSRFANTLTVTIEAEQQKTDGEAQTLISTLFSEMLLARQHIEKAFHLFPPILQIGAV